MRPSRGASPTVIYPAIMMFVLGLAISSLGNPASFSSVNANQIVGPLLFWVSIGLLVLAIPLRDAASAFSQAIRQKLGVTVFVTYLAAHLVLYGFVLDAIYSSIYGFSALAQPFGVLVTTNLFQPLSATSLFFDLTYNPSIIFTVPPVFGAAFSFYGMAIAVIIAVLVLANVERARELGAACTRAKKARSYVVLPVVGIVLGASCCLSVAGVVALAVPAAAVLTTVTWVYYATYFLFPLVAMVLLYVNLRSIERISATVKSSS